MGEVVRHGHGCFSKDEPLGISCQIEDVQVNGGAV
jgi:hypothetical protein